MCVCALPPPGALSNLVKKLTAATCIIQSYSNKLSTLVSESAKCKQMKSYTYALIPELTLGC